MPFNLPRVTKALLIANLVAYLLQWVVGEQAYAFLELWPYVPDAPEQWFMPWQLLTYGFLHDPGNIAHIAFNMLAGQVAAPEAGVARKRFLPMANRPAGLGNL